ncbi:Uncharacterised protein [uncultured archaeon]|nr:Uncharacterised protein [uncultured archaeon]
MVSAIEPLWRSDPQRSAVQNENAAVLCEVGMEGKPQKAAFVVARVQLDHPVADVQKRLFQHGAVGEHHLDHTDLVDQEHPPCAVSGTNELHRSSEPLSNQL